MKILLDENLPKKLKNDFSGIEVYTVREKGWQGKQNGELLNLMIENNFDILITFDKNLKHQQNFSKYPVPVIAIIAPDNTYLKLKKIVPEVKQILSQTLNPGITEIECL